MSEVEQPPAPPVSKEPLDLPFTLTADELDAAALVDAPREAGGGGREPTPISRARFAPLPEPPQRETRAGMDLLAGLQMNVSVELGRTELTVADVLGLGPGSVIELNKLAGEPVDILVNDRLIARGEVVVVDENFGVRVVEVVRRGAEVEERVG
jgi:flagellar motor switch protein FliN/FliY